MKKFLIVFCATLLLLPATVRADEMDLEMQMQADNMDVEMPSLEEIRENMSEASYPDITEQDKLCKAIYDQVTHDYEMFETHIFGYNPINKAKAAIKKGADVNAPCSDGTLGSLPLYKLIIGAAATHVGVNDVLEMAQLLVDNGADVNKVSEVSEGLTLLDWAIVYDHDKHLGEGLGLTWFLLENGVTPETLEAQNRATYGTALCYAAFLNDPGLVSVLIDHGANVNAQVEHEFRESAAFKGWTPLMLAIDNLKFTNTNPKSTAELVESTAEVVRILLDAGADAKRTDNSYGVDALTLFGHSHSGPGYDEIFEMLKEATSE